MCVCDDWDQTVNAFVPRGQLPTYGKPPSLPDHSSTIGPFYLSMCSLSHTLPVMLSAPSLTPIPVPFIRASLPSPSPQCNTYLNHYSRTLLPSINYIQCEMDPHPFLFTTRTTSHLGTKPDHIPIPSQTAGLPVLSLSPPRLQICLCLCPPFASVHDLFPHAPLRNLHLIFRLFPNVPPTPKVPHPCP